MGEVGSFHDFVHWARHGALLSASEAAFYRWRLLLLFIWAEAASSRRDRVVQVSLVAARFLLAREISLAYRAAGAGSIK